MNKSHLTRRKFLGGLGVAAVTAIGAVPAALNPLSKATPPTPPDAKVPDAEGKRITARNLFPTTFTLNAQRPRNRSKLAGTKKV